MRSLLIGVWNLLDPLYYRCTRLTYLNVLNDDHKNILRVRLTRYKGKKVVLSDGTEIKKNDILVKIHLHNVRVLKEITPIVNELKRGKVIYQYVKSSLPDLISYIQRQPECDQIKGIIGITSLNRVANRLGFEIVDISNPIYKRFKWLSSLPIFLLSTPKLATFNNFKKHHAPCYLFMSKPKLFNMYRIKI
ncbi:YkoP family protein [Bacillus sp. Marseille-P3661]|uniref:YkoP family protein n=1 Tax=Bacillus sp. Marseille-P3661 TaxID=1936234 RepID=UPI000C8391A7|nr:hypothetical protein [Bacillus sp. Marseille-P3661]